MKTEKGQAIWEIVILIALTFWACVICFLFMTLLGDIDLTKFIQWLQSIF